MSDTVIKTYDEIIAEMVANVKIIIGEGIVEDDYIVLFCKKAYATSLVVSKYDTLPICYVTLVEDAVVETIRKRGFEGLKSRSALGINSTYEFADLEESLQSKFKNKKNPYSMIGSTKNGLQQ